MRRAVWERVGGFPEHLRSAEDLLFMQRVEAGNTSRSPTRPMLWSNGNCSRISGAPSGGLLFTRATTFARVCGSSGRGRSSSRYLGAVCSWLFPAALLGKWWLAVAVGFLVAAAVARALVAIWRNRRAYPAAVLSQCFTSLDNRAVARGARSGVDSRHAQMGVNGQASFRRKDSDGGPWHLKDAGFCSSRTTGCLTRWGRARCCRICAS